jgi:hypothetical protein
MDPYRALNCEPRIENRGGPGAVVKCNGFAWFSLALSARACLRSISLKFRMCSAALVATTWGLHDAKWRCSKNAFREEPDYLADCTVRDAMVVPPCFRLFASAPPPDRKAAPMRDVYLHRRYAWRVSREHFRGFCRPGTGARSRLHGTTGQPRYEAAVPSDPFPQADAGKVRDLRPGGGEG